MAKVSETATSGEKTNVVNGGFWGARHFTNPGMVWITPLASFKTTLPIISFPCAVNIEALEFWVNCAKDQPFAVNEVAFIDLLFAVLSPTKPSLKETDKLYWAAESNGFDKSRRAIKPAERIFGCKILLKKLRILPTTWFSVESLKPI